MAGEGGCGELDYVTNRPPSWAGGGCGGLDRLTNRPPHGLEGGVRGLDGLTNGPPSRAGGGGCSGQDELTNRPPHGMEEGVRWAVSAGIDAGHLQVHSTYELNQDKFYLQAKGSYDKRQEHRAFRPRTVPTY